MDHTQRRGVDGPRLVLHSELRIDDDGLHGAIGKTRETSLARGRHRTRVEPCNAAGGKALSLGWTGPDSGCDPSPTAVSGR